MPQATYDQASAVNPLRPITAAEPVPWADRSVTLFWFEGSTLQQTTSVVAKRAMAANKDGPQLMAAWTGRHKTELISVDREALAEALL